MYKADIIADSINPVEDRLTTFELVYPMYVHNEFMTHRSHSRNTSSSRAVPISANIKQVNDEPVVPVEWGANERGMVANKLLDPQAALDAEAEWLDARLDAIRHVRNLDTLNVHKQLANRLLQPWQWITVIASATNEGWENFFSLRTAFDAQPEIRKLAWLMAEQYYDNSEPILRVVSDWHLPLYDRTEYDMAQRTVSIREAKISAARCASVSYLRQHDERTDAAWVDLTDGKLVSLGHWSPLEHPAKCMNSHARSGNFRGWRQLRKYYPQELRIFTQADWHSRKNALAVLK